MLGSFERGALYRHSAFRFLRMFRKDYKKWLMKDFDHKIQKEVDQLMGAALPGKYCRMLLFKM